MLPKIRHLQSLPARNPSSTEERGQSIVIITLVFIGVVAMLGLIIDGGNAYLQRRRAQNAADGAAFAGAIALAQPPAGYNPAQTDGYVLGQINTFATNNGISNPSSNIVPYYIDGSGNSLQLVGLGNVPGNAKGVVVTPTLPFNTFFLGVVGENTGAVKATAKASFAPLQSPESIQPLTTPCTQPSLSSCFTFGNSYDLFEGSGPGNFGWLSWDGSNNAPYTEAELDPNHTPPTLNGYDDPHNVCPIGNINVRYNGVQCWVQGAPGVKNSSGNRAQLDDWITRGQAGIPMVIVIYDQSEGSGSNVNYRIAGFAAFILQDYDLPGKWVRGKFIKFVTPGDLCTSNCGDTGLNGVHLRQ